ncbi:MAG: hypothetical protein R3C19_16405 [Planctomycetaceae bacterium]
MLYALSTPTTKPESGLKTEKKTDWSVSRLGAEQVFVHCTSVLPGAVKAEGLNPFKSGEWVVDEKGQPISGGRLIFAFPWTDAGKPKPPKAVALLGFSTQYMYVFRAPKGTYFAAHQGAVKDGAEIAFPYVIEQSDLVATYKQSGAGYITVT